MGKAKFKMKILGILVAMAMAGSVVAQEVSVLEVFERLPGCGVSVFFLFLCISVPSWK